MFWRVKLVMRDLHLEIDNFLMERNLKFTRDNKDPYVTRILFPDNSSFSLFDDRWACKRALVEGVIASRSGNCNTVFARKCNILRHGEDNLHLFKDFLDMYHFYGNAKAKYYLGLEYEGRLVAVASFSQSRPLPRKDGTEADRTVSVPKELNPIYNSGIYEGATSANISGNAKEVPYKIVIVDSYEWVRYASLPGLRVVGGMGRLLKEFERGFCREAESKNHRPYEIMSYADLEFSGGDTYRKLGFLECGVRQPVEFAVIAGSYERVSLSRISEEEKDTILYRFFNMGSVKYIKPFVTV